MTTDSPVSPVRGATHARFGVRGGVLVAGTALILVAGFVTVRPGSSTAGAQAPGEPVTTERQPVPAASATAKGAPVSAATAGPAAPAAAPLATLAPAQNANANAKPSPTPTASARSINGMGPIPKPTPGPGAQTSGSSGGDTACPNGLECPPEP
jgi:hypothetical protein